MFLVHRFRTDGSVVLPGFRMTYTRVTAAEIEPPVVGAPVATIPQTTCGGTLTGSRGVLTSPNYPNNYANGINNCVFTISQPSGTRILLRVVDFRLEGGSSRCPFDYVEIRNGNSERSPLIGKFCGSRRPPSVIRSTHNHLRIR